MRPTYYYGRTHDYVYYPESWTDSASGTTYEKGYYDENGQYYSDVSFSKNGKYENVVCHCPYCGSDTMLNISADSSMRELQCPHCGGPMEIRTTLDEYISDPPVNTQAYNSGGSVNRPQTKKKRKIWPWVLAILLGLSIYGSSLPEEEEPSSLQISQTNQYSETSYGIQSNTDLFGETLYLKNDGYNSFLVLESASGSADKTLVWDSSSDSYYDESSDCWIWYNTNVTPNIWQYWYEGISSEYDEGWMEYDAGEHQWYIEKTYGNWIKLPAKYNTNRLWHIS